LATFRLLAPSNYLRAEDPNAESYALGLFVAGSSLHILFVSAEVSPFAKVGGLADVAGSLPKALSKLGHRVTVVMPAYRMILDDPRWTISNVVESLPIQMNPHWTIDGWVKRIELEDLEVLLVGGDHFFEHATGSESIYLPGIDQYLFFSHAVLEASKAIGLNPDVVHCNDWHTGLIPVLMREKFAHQWNRTSAVFTIHNLAYQGEFGAELLDKVELPQSLFNSNQLETWGRLNFLKAGCVYSDFVNTVSPTYASEIQTPQYGCTLEGLMKHLDSTGRLSGILNGIDYDAFDPSQDPALPAHFDAADLSGKVTCKARLQSELGLPVKPTVPLMGVVSRLSNQKGLDLIVEIAAKLTELPAQLVVQGLGDPWLAGELRRLSKEFPDSIEFVEEFNADLAQRIYAGCDMFLMPSAFEPCGLGQMIAMRNGTVPIVRATGGLADTVIDGVNGFVFAKSEAAELFEAIERAADEFRNITDWGHFVQAGLANDSSWDQRAQEYSDLYVRSVSESIVQSAAAAS
jgi:starch synthase